MQCQDAQNIMNVLLDGELPPEQAERLQYHVETCRSCARELEALRTLVSALDDIPAAKVPARLPRDTMLRFRQERAVPSILDWWRSLSFGLRSAACSVVVAGLLLGIGLGASLTHLQTTTDTQNLVALVHFTGGILP